MLNQPLKGFPFMLAQKRIFIMFLPIHLLFFAAFTEKQAFWILFPLLYTMLMILSMKARPSFRFSVKSAGAGALSGLILYGIFALGYRILLNTPLPVQALVQQLYAAIGPSLWWHHGLLWLIIAGEELFWRSFLQHRILGTLRPLQRVLTAAALYTSVHVYSLNALLILAAIAGGLYWGYLYEKTRNIQIVIISHAVFDLFLLYILPFH
jgi:membrane protease YdiL (CAAX protease family)